ncbi:MAG: hypothetical protein JRI66_12200 [Deltaproteobacteria bacterium]|nr:hypothetical protein [Deltaproteobacteria bacterium]
MSRKISPTCLVLIFCLLFLYSSNNAQAGLNSWTPIGPAFVGEGGSHRYTCSIAFSANFAENGKIFMGDELGYVYIYNKDNNTWSNIYLKEISLEGSAEAAWWLEAMAVAPDDTVFVGSSNGYRVYRSPDSGNTWEDISRFREPGGVPISAHLQFGISPNFVQDGTVFMVGSHGVACSTDRGDNWENKSTGLPSGYILYCIALSPDYSNNSDKPIFVGGYGLYRSTNNGDDWDELGDLPASPNSNKPIVYSLAISPNFPQDQTLFAAVELDTDS